MTASTASDQNVGLFQVRYSVGTGAPGAPMLTLGLTVNVVDRTINGAGASRRRSTRRAISA